MKVRVKKTLRFLDFDIENRPLSYMGYDRVSAEVTAIAAQFIGESATYCWCLGEMSVSEVLEEFTKLYNEADVVVGHYIRGHDLPIIQGQLGELGMPLLGPKLTHDTMKDLVRFKDISKSQENLAAMIGLPLPKVGMNQNEWREANRLTPEGIAGTKQRVIGDVHQNIQLRAALIERGLLGPPKMWTGTGRAERYES